MAFLSIMHILILLWKAKCTVNARCILLYQAKYQRKSNTCFAAFSSIIYLSFKTCIWHAGLVFIYEYVKLLVLWMVQSVGHIMETFGCVQKATYNSPLSFMATTKFNQQEASTVWSCVGLTQQFRCGLWNSRLRVALDACRSSVCRNMKTCLIKWWPI